VLVSGQAEAEFKQLFMNIIFYLYLAKLPFFFVT
jgi:hypothetical protein